MRDYLRFLRKEGEMSQKGVCKQHMIVGFWWLKEEVAVSERILCSSRHISIPIMSSRHCDRAPKLISYAVIQLTTSLPPAAPPAFDKNRGKLKS